MNIVYTLTNNVIHAKLAMGSFKYTLTNNALNFDTAKIIGDLRYFCIVLSVSVSLTFTSSEKVLNTYSTGTECIASF